MACISGRLIAVTLLLVCCESVRADALRYRFGGTLATSQFASHGMEVGEIFGGEFTLDPTLASNGAAPFGLGTWYRTTVANEADYLTLQMGGRNIPVGPPAIPLGVPLFYYVGNNRPVGTGGAPWDYFGISFSTPSIGGSNPGSVTLQLIDTTGTLYSDESLPSTLSLVNFDMARVVHSEPGISVGLDTGGPITTLQLVPEPGTWCLLIVGAGTTSIWAVWRRRQSH